MRKESKKRNFDKLKKNKMRIAKVKVKESNKSLKKGRGIKLSLRIIALALKSN